MRLQLAELTCEEEAEECFERCKEKYGGTTMTDSYYCSKGCAALSDEDVTKIDKYCNIDEESTYVASAAASWRGEATRAPTTSRVGASTDARRPRATSNTSASASTAASTGPGSPRRRRRRRRRPRQRGSARARGTKSPSSLSSASSWSSCSATGGAGCACAPPARSPTSPSRPSTRRGRRSYDRALRPGVLKAGRRAVEGGSPALGAPKCPRASPPPRAPSRAAPRQPAVEKRTQHHSDMAALQGKSRRCVSSPRACET